MITDILPVAALVFIAILIVPAVVGTVNMLRDVGLPARMSPVVAVILGIALMIAYALWGEHRVFVFGLVGLLVGLGACGFYDLTRLIGKTEIPPAEIILNDLDFDDEDDLAVDDFTR